MYDHSLLQFAINADALTGLMGKVAGSINVRDLRPRLDIWLTASLVEC